MNAVPERIRLEMTPEVLYQPLASRRALRHRLSLPGL